MKKLILFFLVVVFVLSSFFVFAFNEESSKISKELLKEAQTNNKVDVIIKFKDPADLNSKIYQRLNSSQKLDFKKNSVNIDREKILKRLENNGIKVKEKFDYSNTISATISKDMLEKLEKSKYVEWVSKEVKLNSFLHDSAGIIGAESFWNTHLDTYPINGTGETVCIIDSGVDYRHDALGNCTIVNNIQYGNNLTYLNSSAHPYDDNSNIIYKINYTGFEKIAVHFSNITMEPEWDYIKILDPNIGNSTIAVYTGYHNDVWTPSVNGDTIYVLLESDDSVTEWGFEIDMVLNGTHNTTLNWSTCNKVIGGWDFSSASTTLDNEDPLDDYSHGTHVAGIISSTDLVYRGIAPGSNIVALKAMNSNGEGSVSDVMASIEYCIENKDRYNISVITMSLGSASLYDTYCDNEYLLYSVFSELVDEAINAGIMVIAAAGNDNDEGIAFPACLENVTAVGATTKSDNIDESYSNFAPILDLLAPGTDITSARYNTDIFYSKDGTSMAAPHIAGAALLLRNFKRLENSSILEPLQIKSILKLTSDNITDSRNSLKFPRINLTRALNYIDDMPRLNFISGNVAGIISSNNIFFNITTSEPCVESILEFNSINYTMQGNSKNFFYNFSDLISGHYNYSIHIKDYTNNIVNSKIVLFEINTEPPNITIVNPVNNSIINQSYNINLSFETNKNSSCLFYYNETKNITGTKNFFYNFSIFETKYTNISINCTDSENQTTSSMIFFTINDTAKPNLLLEITATQSEITFNFLADEPVNSSISLIGGETKLSLERQTTHKFIFTKLSSGTNYDYEILVCDMFGNCNILNGSQETDELSLQEVPDRSSSRTGGGSSSSSSQETTHKAGKFFYNPKKGIQTLEINKENIAVTKLNFEINKDLSQSVFLSIEKIDKLNNTPLPKEEVYQYLKIEKKYIDNSDIDNAEIYFKVPIDWNEKNNIDKEKIKLARYAQKWEYLETEIYKEDNDFIYYKSKTQGFSYFSILVKENEDIAKKEETEIKIVQETNIEEQAPQKIDIAQQSPELKETYNLNKVLLSIFLFLLICLITAIGFYFFLTSSIKN